MPSRPCAAQLQVGEPVVVIVDDKNTVPAFASYSLDDAKSGPSGGAASTEAAAPEPAKDEGKPAPKAESSSKAPPKGGKKETAPKPQAAPAGGAGGRVIASPYARRLAREAGVSLANISASGPNGRIVAEDVQQAIESGSAAPAGAGAAARSGGVDGDAAFADVDVSQIKKVTARRLLESKTTVPHYYLSLECKTDELNSLRKTLNTALEKDGGKVSVNDLVIKAAAKALRSVPEVNASWRGDYIRQYDNVDITVAVQTPAGLMVPVVRDADLKGLSEISAEVKDLAGKVCICCHLMLAVLVLGELYSKPQVSAEHGHAIDLHSEYTCTHTCHALVQPVNRLKGYVSSFEKFSLVCRRRQTSCRRQSTREARSPFQTWACSASAASQQSSTRHKRPSWQ